MSDLAKKSLRKLVKLRLKSLTEAQIAAQSRTVFDAIVNNDRFRNASTVGLFMNMPEMEVHTLELIKHCFDHQKKVYLPKCETNSENGRYMRLLGVDSFHEVMDLKPSGSYDLREPMHGEDVMQSGTLDLMIVPGVAFTMRGDRLGHGAGYYDKFLSEFNNKFGKTPYLIGVGLAEQCVDSMKTEPHDWKMDLVIMGLLNNNHV